MSNISVYDENNAITTNTAGFNSEFYECPVCGNTVKGLTNLNTHLDNVHGFSDEATNIEDISSTNEVQKIIFKGPASDLNVSETATVKKTIKPLSNVGQGEKQKCSKCKKALTLNNAMRYCRRCGKVFCNKDCSYSVKVSRTGEYDPINGEWCYCCYKCFESRNGYNDIGLMIDVSDLYLKARSSKNEDRPLQVLQLENRLVRLVNGMIEIETTNSKSLLAPIKNRKEINKLERTITPWRENYATSYCCICIRYFGLLLRKHHCRLCGRIICDDTITRCSNELSVIKIMEAASELPFNSSVDLISSKIRFRICAGCIKSVFLKRSYYKDVQKKPSQLFLKHEQLQKLSQVILRMLPQFERLHSVLNCHTNPEKTDIEKLASLRKKLLDVFIHYEKLTKQLICIVPENTAEAKIQKSIQSQATSFIQQYMLPLRNIPAILSPSITQPEPQAVENKLLFNNLNIKEVKSYREQLMVLKEQKYIVETTVSTAVKQRKFDEITSLKHNLEEIDSQINKLEHLLGDEGFN